MPWRLLSSVVDITLGDPEQLLRVLRSVDAASRDITLADVEPRLSLARRWIADHVPAAERTHMRTEPDHAALAALFASERAELDLLMRRLTDSWTLAGLTTLVYGVPKLSRGLGLDAPPTPHLKTAQRTFFALVYRLLLGRDTGRRLPTLPARTRPGSVAVVVDRRRARHVHRFGGGHLAGRKLADLKLPA